MHWLDLYHYFGFHEPIDKNFLRNLRFDPQIDGILKINLTFDLLIDRILHFNLRFFLFRVKLRFD